MKDLIENVLPEILAVTFTLVLMIIGYVLLSFGIEVTKSPYFSTLAEKAAKGEIDLLPITVVVAISLFIVRETLDYYRKSKEAGRKREAYKLLISEELELNLWAQKRIHSIVTDIEDEEGNYPNASYTLTVKESGKEYIQGNEDGKLIFGCPVPVVHDRYYEKLISHIAELDAAFFKLSQSCYEEVRNLAHVRSGLIEALLAEENNEPYPHDIRKSGFLDYAKNELPMIYDAMNALYRECAGKELTEARLR